MAELLYSLPPWLWFLIGLVALFLARKPVHQGIYAVARLFHQSFRLGANAVAAADARLQLRNREVLLALGREASERQIERDIERIEHSMKKELAQYPALHRRLCEQLAAIDEDYVRSAEVPPAPSNWAKAIKAVAEIPSNQDPVVADVLETIHGSMRKAESKALEAYRESARERHQLLKRMMPAWRSILNSLGKVNKTVSSVQQRARQVDRHMERYEEIVQGTDRALRILSSSSMSQFIVSGLLLVAAAGCVFINFHLIARPMGAMWEGASYFGDYHFADISALVVILVEITLGIFTMESLRITRLFPAIGALSDRVRARILWVSLSLLILLAALGAGLAYTRELLLQEGASAVAAGAGATDSSVFRVVLSAQLVMGFVFPLVLAFLAIPLESFVNATRTVLGVSISFSLRLLSVALRLIGSGILRAGSIAARIYDIVIFFPLWLEARFLRWREQVAQPDKAKKALPGIEPAK
ncbi:hypothetical protein [Microbulbifer sp. ARAS458-1]|uniref:hypothetical protein n=1 Tax=Microbulbifer sp. ARAS458-1 TaxID=3140242 RepID=UPI0038783553